MMRVIKGNQDIKWIIKCGTELGDPIKIEIKIDEITEVT